MNRLQGKIALISGAASGIGAGIAQAFASEGAQVWVTDIDDARGRVFSDSLGDSSHYHHLDVRQEQEWSAVIDHVLETHGRLDVVVNNAGITGFEGAKVAHDPEHTALADWNAVLATNLDGTFLGCKHALRAMRPQQAGSIINISSRSGLVGIPAAAAYAASKAAIRNHTKTVALYAAEQGWKVRCNSIHPAAILTPMWDPMLGIGAERESRMQAMVNESPLKRFGSVEEVAAVAVLLASDEATYITGTELNIDGGLLAGSAASPKRS
jgi:NAD(P)-dependent dehydrogenase (short-subunit alcohol dehydrogenase family)